MVQTYQGYFREGRFVSPELDTIPDYTEVVIVVTGRTAAAESPKVSRSVVFDADCPLLGMFSDGKISVDRFMAQKQNEKGLEL